MVYHQFAAIYDELMENAPYDAWVQFLQEILKHHHQDHSPTLVELGCGTGEITMRLKKLDYEITGVDMSEEMLVIAKYKALNAQLDIPFIVQDMTALTGFNKTDVFLSFCDVINYITDIGQLKSAFYHVFQQLNTHGLFVFDMHDLDYAQEALINHTFTDETEDVTYIWECVEEVPDIMTHYLTFFVKKDDMYEKFSEIHDQKLYHDRFIYHLLKEVGFSKIDFYSDFKLQNGISPQNSRRKFIVAQK